MQLALGVDWFSEGRAFFGYDSVVQRKVRGDAAAALAELIDRAVTGDAQEPGAKPRILGVILVRFVPNSKKDFLGQFLSNAGLTQDVLRQRVHCIRMALV